MQYSKQVIFNLPLEKVIELFNNPDNLKYWMPELIKSEIISGISGQTSAVGKLTIKDGAKEYQVIETVTQKNLPFEFTRTYDMQNILMIISDSKHQKPNPVHIE
jgi:hypothetical protein